MSFDPQPLLLWFRRDPVNGFVEMGAIPFWLVVAGGLALIVLFASMLSIFVNHRGAGGKDIGRLWRAGIHDCG